MHLGASPLSPSVSWTDTCGSIHPGSGAPAALAQPQNQLRRIQLKLDDVLPLRGALNGHWVWGWASAPWTGLLPLPSSYTFRGCVGTPPAPPILGDGSSCFGSQPVIPRGMSGMLVQVPRGLSPGTAYGCVGASYSLASVGAGVLPLRRPGATSRCVVMRRRPSLGPAASTPGLTFHARIFQRVRRPGGLDPRLASWSLAYLHVGFADAHYLLRQA